MFIYKYRQSDMVFDTAVEVPDGTTVIPKYHAFEEPPEQNGFYAVMTPVGWVLSEGQKPIDPDQDPENIKAKYNAAQKEARAKAYTEEADAIFFMSQRGEATNQDWLNKVAEIKERFPYQV